MTPAEIENLLPEVFRASVAERSLIGGLIAAMSGLQAPADALLGELDRCFDPRRAADAFVPMLARWVDLDRLFSPSAAAMPAPEEAISTGNGRLRELVAQAAELSQWRGTRTGLLAFLEAATGDAGFRIDERVRDAQGRIRPFHLRVHVPPALAPHRDLIERIVQLETPACVTFEIEFNPHES